MGYYDDEDHVKHYLDMVKDDEATLMRSIINRYLKPGMSVLELGSGPGKDYAAIKDSYDVTASDASDIFVRHLKHTYRDARVLKLDAQNFQVDSLYDAILSNKVLQHLTTLELKQSLESQYAALTEEGMIIHSFWYGTGEETYDGLRFVYYDEAVLKQIFENTFEILEMTRYNEMEDGDSIYLIAKKRSHRSIYGC